MAKFNEFTYGVGLEIDAKSFKQVKKDLKVDLDALKALVKGFKEEFRARDVT